ncbi:MAG: hypothetical protein A2Y53_04400 [Chloroflexi bacterium RBG_16_47_49]|nr:MAG: hypothetical protein A2Y53_04400 [Chloroflexi bacterium RBG_16_47_49]
MAVLFACLLLSISACSLIGGGGEQIAPTPLPTSSVQGLQVISPQACLVAEHGMIRVEHPQGDLISWSPVADTVAYIASTVGSSWNVGDLNILSAPSFEVPVRLATQAVGELTWSPEATAIAYLGLRRRDNLYTIGLAYPDGRASKDLFPGEAARTDGFSSQKAVLEWITEGRLRVLASCGVDCMQALDFGVITGLSTSTGSPIQRTWDLWSVRTSQPTQIPASLTDLVGQLNWSPDGKQIAFIDENGIAWIINPETGNLFPLDIGLYGTATETDWSSGSQYLAVQDLKIFSFKCP